MSLQLKQFKSKGESYHLLYINGKPVKERFEYDGKYNNQISTGECFRNESLLKKVQSYPCMEYPDKLDIISFYKKPIMNGLMNCVGIRRNGNRFSIGYNITFRGKLYHNMVWNPSYFLTLLRENIKQYGIEPSPSYDPDDFAGMISCVFRWRTKAEGTVEEKINEGIELIKKAIVLTEKQLRNKAGEFSFFSR